MATKEDKKLLDEALARFTLSEEAERDMRREALDADKFRVGDSQWPQNIKTVRDFEQKPCLTINKTSPAVRQVTNDARQNRPQTKISPTGDGSVNTAKVLEGLIRHIQTDSNSDIAIDRAFDQSVVGGWGYFRVLTDYVDDKSFDQEIKIKPIRNRFTVYADPFCKEPDQSDARWYFVVEDMDRDEFKKLYPKAQAGSNDFVTAGDKMSGWITEKSVRIAEYWCVEEKTKKVYQLEDGTVVDSVPDGMKAVKDRDVVTRNVCQYKITGCDVLEKNEWAGKYIPIIRVLGEDNDIDGKRIVRGMVHDMMDSQRVYNYYSTAQVELVALAPKSPWVIAAGQLEGFEKVWETANRSNHSHLPYNPITINGTLAPPPMRQTAEPPIQAMAMVTRQAAEDMKDVSGIYAANLGQPSNETSGRAILARQHQGDTSNFHYVDNLTRALRFLGRVLLDLIPKIYDTQRIVRIVNEDMSHAEITNAPGQQEDPIKKVFDLTTGKYDVVVETGPSFNTKRQETAASMADIIQAYPNLMGLAGDILVKYLDWPGHEELMMRLKKALPPNLQDNPEQNPQVIQAKLQESQQMIDALTKALNEAHDLADAKKLELESKERIATQANETNLVIAELKQSMTNNMAMFREELAHLRHDKDLQAQTVAAEQHSEIQEQIPQQSPQA
jgi:hypothetical protein